MPRSAPLISVIILNWNGKKHLVRCLRSLQNVLIPKNEVIVVDNNSTDGSQAYVKKYFPLVRLLSQSYNTGFSEGNNIGASESRGKYLLFLNNDTVVKSSFLEILVTRIEKDDNIGCVQPQIRILDKKNLLDQVGSYLTSTGFLYHMGFKKPFNYSLYKHEREIFSAKGACMLIPKLVFNAIGGFDEDFFIFFEETDLCYRIWLSGKKILYVPNAVIYHKTGGDTVDSYKYENRLYLSTRNMIMSYLKNFGSYYLLSIFPILVIVHMCLFLYFIGLGRIGNGLAMFKAYAWNIRSFHTTLKKRIKVQHSLRVVSDVKLNSRILKNPKLIYYYYLLTNLQHYEDRI